MKNNRYRVILILSSALCLISIILTGFSILTLQPEIPLWYTLTSANQNLANKWWLTLIPTISLLMTASIFGAVSFSKKIDEFIILMHCWSTIIGQSILLLALIRIMLII